MLILTKMMIKAKKGNYLRELTGQVIPTKAMCGGSLSSPSEKCLACRVNQQQRLIERLL